jgi:hypothetical protein
MCAARLPHPSECDLFYVDRDTLFSFHKVRAIPGGLTSRLFLCSGQLRVVVLSSSQGACEHGVGWLVASPLPGGGDRPRVGRMAAATRAWE